MMASYQLRHRMLHFMQNLVYYMMVEVRGCKRRCIKLVARIGLIVHPARGEARHWRTRG